SKMVTIEEFTAETFRYDTVEIQLQLHPLVWTPTSFANAMATHVAKVLNSGDRVLELGLGSGVLAILAAKLGASQVTGLDINKQAIIMAKNNWLQNGLNISQADFRHSDLLNALNATDAHCFDLIISNPPVLPQLDIEAIHTPSTRDEFEISGQDGRRVLDTVLSQTGQYL
ncbi:hypothetical protein TI05_19650, partial [Achromatium sp. WMS3]